MSDLPGDEPMTDEELLEDEERFDRPYDEIFLPDGSLLLPMSVLDDPGSYGDLR